MAAGPASELLAPIQALTSPISVCVRATLAQGD
jgi:hypothetical protein